MPDSPTAPSQPSRGTAARRAPSPRYRRRIEDARVRADLRILGLFVGVYCGGRHRDLAREPHRSPAVDADVYGRRVPVLCQDCSQHLEYGEARRVFCILDPKPFCAHCPVHCFKDSERQWNRTMMRYSGRRSLTRGFAREGARHFAGSVGIRVRALGRRLHTALRGA